MIVLDACPDVPTESCASTTVPGVPQLVQNKTVDQASAPVGGTLTYTMTLANTGTGDATGVVAQDALPAGTGFVSADTDGFGTFDAATGAWNIGTIAAGTTATLTVTATVEPQAAGSTLVNAFQVVEPLILLLSSWTTPVRAPTRTPRAPPPRCRAYLSSPSPRSSMPRKR